MPWWRSLTATTKLKEFFGPRNDTGHDQRVMHNNRQPYTTTYTPMPTEQGKAASLRSCRRCSPMTCWWGDEEDWCGSFYGLWIDQQGTCSIYNCDINYEMAFFFTFKYRVNIVRRKNWRFEQKTFIDGPKADSRYCTLCLLLYSYISHISHIHNGCVPYKYHLNKGIFIRMINNDVALLKGHNWPRWNNLSHIVLELGFTSIPTNLSINIQYD